MYKRIGNEGYVMENKNKYLEILDKDPHNFDALKGLLFFEEFKEFYLLSKKYRKAEWLLSYRR